MSDTEYLVELDRDGRLELLVGTRRRIAVGSPPLEACGVPEPVTLQVLVRDFGDELDAQRLPAEVFARVPAAQTTGHALAARLGLGPSPLLPGVVGHRILPVRRNLLGELLSKRGVEAARDADVVQSAGAVEQPEQQRPHATFLVLAIAGDRAVGGAEVLHLLHRSLARPVGAVERLGDDTVEPGALEALEPFG